MEHIILDRIPFEVDDKGLAELLRIKPGSRHEGEFSQVLGEAGALARPKAAFAVAEARAVDSATVEIAGVPFTSRVLRANLEHAGMVFPYAATCGIELEEWAQSMDSTLRSFWADSIMIMALACAVSFLERSLKGRLGGSAPLSTMNPGALEDWPLGAQAPLFSLLGGCASAIGVTLTDKMVLRPLKSVSGIQFVSEEGFVSCSLCPRQGCPSRRSEFDTEQLRKKIS
jgi:hypothetical protein